MTCPELMFTKEPGYESRPFSIHIHVVAYPLNLLGSIHIHVHTHKNSTIGIFWGEDLHDRRTDVERNFSRNLLKSDSCEYST